jgi:anti-anti-sigma factor
LTYLKIQELHDGSCLRLRITGELDLGSAPAVRVRLEELRAEKLPTLLDLSGLQFMDSTGIHLLVNVFDRARAEGWDFEIEPVLTPQVERLFELANVRFLVGSLAMDGS